MNGKAAGQARGWLRSRAFAVPIGIRGCRRLSVAGLSVAALLVSASPAWATTWISQTSISTDYFRSVSCASATTCQAVGPGHSIEGTTNGGATWTDESANTPPPPPLATNNDYSGVSCPSTSQCWVVGTNGKILTTTDGGSTWSSQRSGETSDLSSISCPSATVCFVADGGILATTDGGTVWTPEPNPSRGSVTAITCVSTQLCWAVGGGIENTADGGQTWSNQLGFGPNTTLNGISCRSSSECFAVGNDATGGIIASTTDGGADWSIASVGTPGTSLTGVSCPATGGWCWVVSNSATIFRGSSTWTPESAPSGVNSLDAVSCPNTAQCYAVGDRIVFGEAPPVSTTAPAITGTAAESATLTAGNGTWGGAPPFSYSYQWQGCSAAGTNCTNISGATDPSYVPGSSDVGSTMRVKVIASNPAGSASQTSSQTGIVKAGPSLSLSGAAYDTPVQTTNSGSIPLDVSATEPNGPGIVSIATTVNGQSYANGPHATQSCSAGACPLSANGTINLADLQPGDNDVIVTATDAAGNSTPVEWSILLPGPEDSSVQTLAAQSMSTDLGISIADANSRLAYQDSVAPLLDSIDAAIGTSASGSEWFDSSTGRLEIGVVSSTNPPSGSNVDAAKQILSDHGLLGDADFVTVAHSYSDLQNGQAQLDQQLIGLEDANLVLIGIDPSTNSVLLDEADDLTAAQQAEIAAAIAASTVRVTTTTEPTGDLGAVAAVPGTVPSPPPPPPSASSCATRDVFGDGDLWVVCDPSLRGGVTINSETAPSAFVCTLGFPAEGTGGGQAGIAIPAGSKVVLTAGHCLYDARTQSLETQPNWTSYDSLGLAHRFFGGGPGAAYGYEYGQYTNGTGDDGYLTVNLVNQPYWMPHAGIYAGTANPDYSITGAGTVRKGEMVCLTSANPLSTSSSGFDHSDNSQNKHVVCAKVRNPDVYRINFGPAHSPKYIYHLVQTNIQTIVEGSSGGPMWKDHIGYGLNVGVMKNAPHYELFQNIGLPLQRWGAKISGF